MFKLCIFGTGSRGNSALVSDGETSILIDAGLMPTGIMITDIKAVLISHSHIDHVKYVCCLARKYARTIYLTRGTFSETDVPFGFKSFIQYGVPFAVGTLTITPFPLSHDAAEPCGFFIKNELGETLVWASDTGTMDGLQMNKPADCYVIEANYDENTIDEKLQRGELPYAGLHGRLTSEFGHLSVQQAAAWLKENARPESHIIVLTSHPEVIVPNVHLFDGLVAISPAKFPFQFEFGKKCPFCTFDE